MKYVHPDIVVGEPIPEIEARIDHDRLAVVRQCNTWWRYCYVIAGVMIVFSILSDPGLIVGIIMMAAIMVLWLIPIFHPKMRAQVRRMREAKRLSGSLNADIWSIPFRDNAEHQIMTMGLIVISPILIDAGGGLGSVLSMVGIYAFMGGFGVIVYGYYARQPGQISCTECSYPLVGLTIDCKCPECGVWILAPNYTTDCPRIRSPWFWRIGLTISILGGAITYISFANPSAFYAPVPRAVLFNLAPTDRQAFERLVNNPMTQEETDQLIERFITSDVFDEGAFESYQQRQWLAQQFAAGSLSDDQVDRIIEPYLDLRISAPDSVGVGDRITLWINSVNQIGYSIHFDPLLYFGGFIIGQDPIPRERTTRPERLEEIQNIKYDVPSTRRPHLVSPETVWIPEKPGVIEINATIVIAIFPRSTSVELTWGEDGHAFNVQPDWIRVINLQRTVIIELASEGGDGG